MLCASSSLSFFKSTDKSSPIAQSIMFGCIHFVGYVVADSIGRWQEPYASNFKDNQLVR